MIAQEKKKSTRAAIQVNMKCYLQPILIIECDAHMSEKG